MLSTVKVFLGSGRCNPFFSVLYVYKFEVYFVHQSLKFCETFICNQISFHIWNASWSIYTGNQLLPMITSSSKEFTRPR